MIKEVNQISNFQDGTYMISGIKDGVFKKAICRIEDVKSIQQLYAELDWVYNDRNCVIISVSRLGD